MSNNSQETGAISVNDAINSLLTTTPETDKVEEGRLEAEQASPLETETEELVEDTLEAEPEADFDEEVYEGEDTETEVDEEEAEEEPLYSVSIDGEEYEVNLDELRNGYQRQQVFTRRMQEIAKEREVVRQETDQARQQRDEYAKQLEVYGGQIQQTIQKEPDWRALSEQGYSEKDLFLAKAEWDKQKAELDRVQLEQQRITSEQAKENEARMREYLASQRQEMIERIPSWKDEEKRDAERVEVVKYAQRIGFTEDEIANATDARAIELLHKAWLWDSLQKKKPDAKKRVKQAPKMAKAGTPKTKTQVASRQRQQAISRLNKEKSVDAAVSYLMGR